MILLCRPKISKQGVKGLTVEEPRNGRTTVTEGLPAKETAADMQAFC